jgi:S-adenosylmethionine decarboxylase
VSTPVTTKPHFGKHYLVDFKQCDPETIERVEATRPIFLEAARQAKATVVGELFHQFDPVGVSGVLLIAESHVSVHTWPEDAFVAVDIFTCGEEMDAEIAIDVLTQGFRAAQVDVKVLLRGRLEDTDAERGRDG